MTKLAKSALMYSVLLYYDKEMASPGECKLIMKDREMHKELSMLFLIKIYISLAFRSFVAFFGV